MEFPNTLRSHPGSFQTPPGTMNRNFRACREASRHRQARQIMTCEPPKHKQSRLILILQAPRAPKILQDPPTGVCGAPDHVKKPSDSLHGAYVKRPESQRDPNEPPKTLSPRCERRNARSGWNNTVTITCERPHTARQARPLGDGQMMSRRFRKWPRLSTAPISLEDCDSGSFEEFS